MFCPPPFLSSNLRLLSDGRSKRRRPASFGAFNRSASALRMAATCALSSPSLAVTLACAAAFDSSSSHFSTSDFSKAISCSMDSYVSRSSLLMRGMRCVLAATRFSNADISVPLAARISSRVLACPKIDELAPEEARRTIYDQDGGSWRFSTGDQRSQGAESNHPMGGGWHFV